MSLYIAKKKDSLVLPDSTVTEKFGIVGASGYGKTHLATVLLEEMLEQRLPVAVIDPEGVFWGLGSSIDGKSPGYKVIVLGGSHGNLDLKPTSGTAMAELVVRTRQPMIFDLSNFDDEDDEALFVAAFAQTLYQRNGIERRPIHLYCDEIDKFAPEQPMSKAQIASTKALKNVFQRGRGRGIGATAITQRPAVVKKDILYQVRCLVTFNLPGPLDQDAISRWMIKPANIDKKERDHFLSTLPKLQRGHAWLWSPAWLNVMQQVVVRERRTFDSSKTPEVGASMLTPVRQEIDLEAIRSIMAELVDRNEQDDPTTLRARVRELETKLATQPSAPAPAPIVNNEDMRSLYEAHTDVVNIGNVVSKLAGELAVLHDKIGTLHQTISGRMGGQPIAKIHYLNEAHELPRTTKAAARRERRVTAAPTDNSGAREKSTSKVAAVPEELKVFRKGERDMLITLYDFGGHLSRRQLGTMVGIKPKGSTMGTYLTTLKSNAVATYTMVDVTLTDTGKTLLARVLNRKPMPHKQDQLLEIWRKKLRKGERDILDTVVQAPNGITRKDMAEKLDIAPDGSTIGTYLSTLRSNALINDDGELLTIGDALAISRAPRRRASNA